MDRDEMLRLWRGQSEPGGPSPEEIVMEVRERARRFDRKLFWRDAAEVAAGLLFAALALGVAVQAPGWWPKLGAFAAVAIIAWVLSRLLGARRKGYQGVSESMALAERLAAEVDKVEAQIELLSSVRSWYLWPLAWAGTLWALSMVPALDLPLGPSVGALTFLLASCAVIFTAVGYVVEKANHRAVAEHLEPYRQDLRDLLGQLERP